MAGATFVAVATDTDDEIVDAEVVNDPTPEPMTDLTADRQV